MSSAKLRLFDVAQSLPSYKSLLECKLSPRHDLIALQSENCIDLLSLGKKSFLRNATAYAIVLNLSKSSAINSFVWSSDEPVVDSGQSSSVFLAISHVTGNLSIYELQGAQSTCTTELHRLTFKSLIKEVSSIDLAVNKVQVLKYSSDLLTVLVDRQLVVQLKVDKTNPWQIVYTVECPHQVLHACVTRNILVLIDSDHSILLYNVKNKEFLAVIQREKGRCWNSCQLSSDYLQLTLQNDDGELYICNMDSYFKKNSLLINRTQTSQQDQSAGIVHWFSHTSLSEEVEKSEIKRKFHSSKVLYKMSLPGDCLSYQCTTDHVSAVCHSKGQMVLLSYCVSNGQTDKMECTAEDYVVLSDRETIPHIIISDAQVSVAAIGHFFKHYKQEDAIGGGLLTIIAAINGWNKQKDGPDVNKLITAIQNRDTSGVLDYIKLYKSLVDDLMLSPPIDNREQVAQMCSLIFSAASTYVKHSATKSFAMHVAEATLAFLKEQSTKGLKKLNEILINDTMLKKGLMESFLDMISDHSMHFDELVKANTKVVTVSEATVKPKPAKTSTTSKQSSTLLTEDLIGKWNSLSSSELIGDGILMGQIALLQEYFTFKNRHAEASWDFIVKTGLQCMLVELEAENWTTACQMLKNMGFGVFTKLTQIAMYTTDSKLRKYLVHQLTLEGQFSGVELEAISVAEEIDRLYPCQSFQTALALRQKRDAVHSLPIADVFAVSKYCGDISAMSSGDETSPWYSHYMLDWVGHWLPYKDDIRIDRCIRQQDEESKDELAKVPSGSVWSYLCRHNSIETILSWVDVVYGGEKALQSFQTHSISMDMIDEASARLPSVSKIRLLDRLTSYDVHSNSVLLSPQRKFNALAKTGMLKDREKAEGLLSVHELICHCVERGLFELLYTYFSMWQVSDEEITALESKMAGKEYLFVVMLYSFYKLSVHGPESALILDASLASSRYLARSPFLSHSQLLDKQLTDVALCNLMYHSPILQFVAVPEGSKQELSAEQMAIYREHPLLKYLFETIDDSTSSDMPTISIYSLLKKWGTLHIDRLFKDQMAEEAADSSTEMSHFANKELASKYGVEVKLTFVHYLKECRPSFAFLVFLSDETSMSNNSSISSARVKLAVRQTHYIAIKYYDELGVAASCVAFLELMGETTHRLRLLINSAQIIHEWKLKKDHTKDSEAVHSQVESLMLPAVFSVKSSVAEAYEELIEAVDDLIHSTDVADGLKWKTVVDFAQVYNFTPPVRFLQHCAEQDNWLSFLIYIQVFNYSVEQVAEMVAMFTSDGVREHLQCVMHTMGERLSEVLPRAKQEEKRDRANSKGLSTVTKRHKGGSVLVLSSDDERKLKDKQETVSNPACPAVSADSAASVNQLPNDIFMVLLLSSDKPCPWRYLNSCALQLSHPVISVLAVCDKESSQLECLSCWLASSLPEFSTLASEYKTLTAGKGVDRKYLISAINCCVDNDRLRLLQTGLYIFIQESPLLCLLQAVTLVESQQFMEVTSHLSDYKSGMKKVHQAVDVSEGTLTFTELVTLSLNIIQACIRGLECFLVQHFLHFLDETNLISVFKEQHVNFGYIYRVYKVVYEQRLLGVDCFKLAIPSSCMDTIGDVLRALVERGLFDIARNLSKSCNLDPAEVSIQELVSDTSQARLSAGWSESGDNSQFWTACHNKCMKYDINPEQCSAFFQLQASLAVTNLTDKIQLSQFALDWMKQSPTAMESGKLFQLQKLVWQSKIDLFMHSDADADDALQPLTNVVKRPPTTVSIDKTQFLQLEQRHEAMLNLLHTSTVTTEKTVAISKLIGQLLDSSRIDEACQVSLEFKYTTQDVVIIQVCLGVAMRRLDPLQLDERIEALLGEPVARKRRSSSLSSTYLLSLSNSDEFSPAVFTDSAGPQPMDRRLSLLRRLCDQCKCGTKACERILCCYSIAVGMGLPYRDTILQSEYSLLKQLLTSQMVEKYSLALEYINTCSLSDSDVSSFLSSHVYNILQSAAGLQASTNQLGGESLTASRDQCIKTGKECKHLIQLLTDQSMFGQSLLEEATNITIDEHDTQLKLMVKVELLILSHDAYSCAYDMEGISSLLRACRACAIEMNNVSSYTLMVHMLTGIGRYSEMTYIFDTLKQNHQFELLFRKGGAKDNKLKLAVLDYLRRFCPDDLDIYRMVSSHFAMYREIADLLEQTALRKLRAQPPVSAKNQDSLASSLTNIHRNLTDAAEIYLEGRCLQHAQVCVKQARLVHLQNSLLSSGTQVVNLSPPAVRSFLENHDKFYHAFAVSEAYNKNYWAASLCNNALVKGDTKYLTEYCKTFTLTPSFITEVIQRFQMRTDVSRGSHTDASLRKLLAQCRDVAVKYKLAHSLGLSDVTRDMMAADHCLVAAVVKDSRIGSSN